MKKCPQIEEDWIFFLLDFKEKDCFLLEVFFELAVMFASLKLPSGCSYMLIISACFFLRVFLCVYAVYQDVCVVFSFPLFPLCSYRCFQVACHTFFSICLFVFYISFAVLRFPLLILSQQHNQNRIENGEVGTGSVLPIGSSHPSLLPFCSHVLY